MIMETDTVSGWFILNSGFKVYGRCPVCQSPRISYHKDRKPGLKGISSSSQGLTPACMDCGKSLPTQVNREQKQIQFKLETKRMF